MKCSLRHEKLLRTNGCNIVAGIDEAGRGPLAGPVVAAIAILPANFRHGFLRDSKQLTHKQRDEIYSELTTRKNLFWAVEVVENEEIDRINILRATHEAMRRTARRLFPQPDHVLIDGLPVPHFPLPHTALVGGDGLSYSIAAASVIAKVTRDRIMAQMDELHPGYDFSRHKGYGTALHLERLKEHGPCPIHRRTFLPVRQALFPFAEA
ncbi:MAG: rnhB [Chthoniobacteraceae bacterium]|nr:rnhB [Chthoniobacteraceae bacterium]